MSDWVRKVGSTTGHPIEAILQDANGPVGLPSGTLVTIRARAPGSTAVKFSSAAIVVAPGALMGDPDRGKVQYTPNSTDLDTSGIYDVDFVATIPGLGDQTFPESGYNNQLLIVPGVDTL